MKQTIGAFRNITATSEFQEKARLYAKARHDEAQALKNAEKHGEQRGERRGEQRANEKWRNVVADKDARIADKDARIADKDARIAELLARLGEQ